MLAAGLRCGLPERRIAALSQRNIELLIGRLVTDDAFRLAFVKNLAKTLSAFIESGHELTAQEIQALITSSPSFWSEVAAEIGRASCRERVSNCV